MSESCQYCQEFREDCNKYLTEIETLRRQVEELETECAVHATCTRAKAEQLAAMTKERNEAIKVRNDAILENNTSREQLAAMTKERDDLLAEKSRWIARANNYLGQACENVSANSMLIAAQDDNARLREALESCRGSVKFDLLRYERMSLDYKRLGPEGEQMHLISEAEANRLHSLVDSIDSLALSTDHAALDARLKEERERCEAACQSVEDEGVISEEETSGVFKCIAAIRNLT
jgi:hypothetical protein